MHKSPFEADPRNLGGRTETATKMYNHQKALDTIKPNINKNDKPKDHVDAGKIKKPLLYQQQQKYGLVYKTFNSVHTNTKPLINTKAPQTMSFKHMNQSVKNPKLRQNKQEQFIMEEHQRKLEAQERRKKAIHYERERKKNNNDPVSNPVMLFRRGKDTKGVNQFMDVKGTRSVQLGMTQKRTSTANGSRSYVKEGGSEKKGDIEDIREWYRNKNIEKGKREPVHDKNQKKRPMTAKEKQEYDEMFKEAEKNNFIYEVPKTQEDTEEDYQYIKMKVIELIVKYRIYTDQDLKILEGRTILHNSHMERDRIEGIFSEIYEDLDR